MTTDELKKKAENFKAEFPIELIEDEEKRKWFLAIYSLIDWMIHTEKRLEALEEL